MRGHCCRRIEYELNFRSNIGIFDEFFETLTTCEYGSVKLFLADVQEDRFRTLFFSRESRRNESEGEAPTSNASLSVSLCKCQAVCQGNLHTLARPSPFPAYDLCGIMSRHNLKKLSS